VRANGETTMKPQIHPCIAMITLIAVFATAGCLEPAKTAVNATPEPTLEPCETCTVPEDFCGPPGVCPGEPVNGVYAFTDKNVYRIGDVVEFGIVNCGDEPVEFGNPRPWWIDRWVTNESGCMPGNCTGGTWELVGNAGCAPTVVCFLDPGENWTVRWAQTPHDLGIILFTSSSFFQSRLSNRKIYILVIPNIISYGRLGSCLAGRAAPEG